MVENRLEISWNLTPCSASHPHPDSSDCPKSSNRPSRFRPALAAEGRRTGWCGICVTFFRVRTDTVCKCRQKKEEGVPFAFWIRSYWDASVGYPTNENLSGTWIQSLPASWCPRKGAWSGATSRRAKERMVPFDSGHWCQSWFVILWGPGLSCLWVLQNQMICSIPWVFLSSNGHFLWSVHGPLDYLQASGAPNCGQNLSNRLDYSEQKTSKYLWIAIFFWLSWTMKTKIHNRL